MQIQTQLKSVSTGIRGGGAKWDGRKLAELSVPELKELQVRCAPDLMYYVNVELDTRATNELMARQKADYEFRQDVVEELMAEGKSRVVAENLTNTEAKMLAEARRVGII